MLSAELSRRDRISPSALTFGLRHNVLKTITAKTIKVNIPRAFALRHCLPGRRFLDVEAYDRKFPADVLGNIMCGM
jgi:hypothetical protein